MAYYTNKADFLGDVNTCVLLGPAPMSTAPQPPQQQPSFPHSGPSGPRSPGELEGAQPRAALWRFADMYS